MRKIFLTVNTDTADLRYVSSPADVIMNPADAPQIYSGEEVVFCVSFIDADLQPVTFSTSDIFDFGIDTNIDHTDDLMAYTNQINQAGDWSAADVTAGKISFRVNTATTAAAEKLAALDVLQVKLEIRQFVSGSPLPSILCQALAVMHNTVIGTDPSAPDAEIYLTAAQVTSITNALAEDVTAAQTTAAAAQSTANEAETNAATAQNTADQAVTTAPAAQNTADQAVTTAAAAQNTADQAVTVAETAQTAADTAQATANSKITAPTVAGTAGQILTLGTNGTTEWKDEITFNSAEFSGTDEIKLNTSTANRYTTASNTVDYVKERWMAQDGSSWYRLWASGWLEQGGTFQGYAYNNENRFFTFPKEFEYTDYICVGSCATTENTTQYTRTVYFGAKTTTSVAIATGVNGSTAISQMTNVYFAGWSA